MHLCALSQAPPKVVWSPAFACCMDDVGEKIPPGALTMSQRSCLLLEGEGIRIESLHLDGALRIKAAKGAKVIVRNMRVKNAGWAWVPLEEGSEGAAASEEERMRGFRVAVHETRDVIFTEPGDYLVEA